MNAHVVIKPAAAKRLIARGVAALPAVTRALAEGTVVITLGTTNAYVAAELTGDPIDHGAFAAGLIDDRWNVNARLGEAREVVLVRGARSAVEEATLLESLATGDLLIKGANALDPLGVAGVLMAAPNGGTIGKYVPTCLARGIEVVVPVSVAKSIHASIGDLSQRMGSHRLTQGDGLACGLYPLAGTVVTEIEALHLLYSVEAVHVASGGVGEGIGSVSLTLDGRDEDVARALAALNELKSEPEPHVQGRA